MSKKTKTVRCVLAGALLVASTAVAQAQTISGTVKDATGEPVIGATVMEQGTTNGTVTDFDGNYTITLKGKSQKLTFSYVGMQNQTVSVAGKSNVNVDLKDDAQMLDEMVVIGYGSVRKKDLTGAVTQVGAKQIENVPVANVSEALTGKMAGVNITTSEGSPDADVKIRVRGGGSLSQDNSPLYIVDGFPVASISDISPSEIETIDVLKDASSTAIYGAQGANGVVIVTTKSGKEGKVQVNFNASHSWKNITKKLSVLNPYEYALYQYEINSATNSPTSLDATASNYGRWQDLDIWKSVDGSDWQDEIFGRTGQQNQYNLSVSGGSKEVKFNVSYAHNDEDAIMRASGYSKDNINAKLNANINKWLKLDFTARLAYTKVNGLSGGSDTNESNAANSIVYNTLIFAPIDELSANTDEDENNSTSTRRNPVQRLDGTDKEQRRFRQDYNASLTWTPFKHWTFRTEFGYNWRYNKTEQAWTADAVSNSKYGYNGAPQYYLNNTEYRGFRNANTVTYDNKKLFGGRDAINVMVGQEWSSTRQNQTTAVSVNFPYNFTLDQVKADLGTGTALPTDSYISEDDNLASFFGRVNYTLMDRFLLTATLRADGSSKFGKGNQWGLFPSVAVAWRMSDEKWLKDVDWLSNLKLRLSYGTAGNNRIPAGTRYITYSVSDATGKHPGFDNASTAMMERPNVLYNPNLKWETTTTRNFGIDYGFFKGRLSGSLELYWNTTSDLLMKKQIASASGYSYQYQNFGKTSNKGVEFSLNSVLVDKKNFNLNFNFNIAYNKSKIDELNDGSQYVTSSWGGSRITKGTGDYFLEEGGQLGDVYGYKSNGYYTVATKDANGVYTGGQLILDGQNWRLLRASDGYVDANGNAVEIKDGSSELFGNLYPGTARVEVDEDGNPVYQKIGNTLPTTTGGFGFDGQWKNKWGNIDFNVFFNYSLGNKVVNGTRLASSFFSGSSKGYNILSDWDSSSRYKWVDPETGLNLGRPSGNTIAYYGSAQAVMDRLVELNASATQWNPAANTKMVLVSDALENASFLRLQNITIGYSFPKDMLKRILIENLRVYFTAYNVACITGYSGYDPEVDTSSSNNPMTPGVDFAAYPKSRTFTVGLNVTF